MKRNLRFWTRYTWESLESELAVMGMFLVFMVFNSDYLMDGRGWLDILALVPYYLLIAAVFCIIMVVFSGQILYVPLLISHGEPRRNVYWGFQYHRFLLIAVTSAVSALIWALVPGELSAACLSGMPVIVTGLVIISAFGGLMGSFYVKWKAVGVVTMVLLFGCGGGIAGWTISSGGFDMSEISISALELTKLPLPWQLLLASVVLLAVDLGVQWLMLRRREVKL